MNPLNNTLYPGRLWFLLLCFWVLQSCQSPKSPKVDWRVQLKRDAKNPYDTYLAYQSLPYYFPHAQQKTKYSDFDFTRVANLYGVADYSLFIIIARSLYFSEAEQSALLDYVASGNYVCIASAHIDDELLAHFSLRQSEETISDPLLYEYQAEASEHCFFLANNPSQALGYRGRSIRSYFSFSDTGVLAWKNGILQRDPNAYENRVLAFMRGEINHDTTMPEELLPAVMSFRYGKGKFVFVASPLVLSNYFLMQDRNRKLLDVLWGEVSTDIRTVYWTNFTDRSSSASGLSILWRHPATRMALILAIVAIVVFLIFETRRRQRIVPVIIAADNSTMAFIETVGMLYYNKSDNRNLAAKMEQHFLDWVRTRYYLNTQILDEVFIEQLTMKSGLPQEEVSALIKMIHRTRTGEILFADEVLLDFYRRIHHFYKQK